MDCGAPAGLCLGPLRLRLLASGYGVALRGRDRGLPAAERGVQRGQLPADSVNMVEEVAPVRLKCTLLLHHQHADQSG